MSGATIAMMITSNHVRELCRVGMSFTRLLSAFLGPKLTVSRPHQMHEAVLVNTEPSPSSEDQQWAPLLVLLGLSWATIRKAVHDGRLRLIFTLQVSKCGIWWCCQRARHHEPGPHGRPHFESYRYKLALHILVDEFCVSCPLITDFVGLSV